MKLLDLFIARLSLIVYLPLPSSMVFEVRFPWGSSCYTSYPHIAQQIASRCHCKIYCRLKESVGGYING
jgi:hypothetical protein